MHDRNVARKNMKWLTMDVTKMELEDNTFSAVVDKVNFNVERIVFY